MHRYMANSAVGCHWARRLWADDELPDINTGATQVSTCCRCQWHAVDALCAYDSQAMYARQLRTREHRRITQVSEYAQQRLAGTELTGQGRRAESGGEIDLESARRWERSLRFSLVAVPAARGARIAAAVAAQRGQRLGRQAPVLWRRALWQGGRVRARGDCWRGPTRRAARRGSRPR